MYVSTRAAEMAAVTDNMTDVQFEIFLEEVRSVRDVRQKEIRRARVEVAEEDALRIKRSH